MNPEDKDDEEALRAAEQRARERFEAMKQRAIAAERQRMAIEQRPIGLPRYMWDELEAQADMLSMTPSELVRVWLADRLGGEK